MLDETPDSSVPPDHPVEGVTTSDPNQSDASTGSIPKAHLSSTPQEDQAFLDLLARLDRGESTPTEQAMVEHQIQVVQVTAGELRVAAKRNSAHPLASHFVGACAGFSDSQAVYVEQPDLQALLQNRESVMKHEKIGNRIVRTKFIR